MEERKKASDYPQELLDLFQEYQHGDISRRDFLDRAGRFTVGGMTAAAIFETLRPNYAWAQQVPKDDTRLKTEYATAASPQGNGSIKGYFARPATGSGKLPGVLAPEEVLRLLEAAPAPSTRRRPAPPMGPRAMEVVALKVSGKFAARVLAVLFEHDPASYIVFLSPMFANLTPT